MSEVEQMDFEIHVEHDDLIAQFERIAREEYARGSDASESAAVTKEFLEETGINSQAMSWGKTIYKKRQKKDGDLKALDVINSLELILPMLKDEILGQSPQLPLEAEPAEDDVPDPGEDIDGMDADNVEPFDPSTAAAE